jgi:hypothetical protein
MELNDGARRFRLPKGELRVKMKLNSLEEASRWVLSFENHATVIGPAALAERIGKVGSRLAERYSGA